MDYKKALEYAKQNPNSPFALEFRKRIESGKINPSDYVAKDEQNKPETTDETIANFHNEITESMKGVQSGFQKGVIESLRNIASIGEKYISKPLGRLVTPKRNEEALGLSKDKKTSAEQLIPDEKLDAKNDNEKAGKIIETVAEYALPTKWVSNAEKALSLSGKTLKAIAGRSAIEAGVGATQGTIKSGEIGEDALKEGAITGGATAVLGLTGKAVTSGVNFFRPTENSAIIKAVKPSITKNRNLASVNETMSVANNEIVKQGFKPRNLSEYASSIEKAKTNIWSNIQSKLDRNATAEVDYTQIANKLSDFLDGNNTLDVVDPLSKRKVINLTKRLYERGRGTVIEAENMKQLLNAELNSSYGSFNIGDVEKNAKKLINAEIGKQLDQILSSVPNEFSSLKKTWGALRQTQDDVLKRMLVFQRQNPVSLFEGLGKISGVGDIVGGVITANPTRVFQGASEIGMGKLIKRANDADELIKRGFKDIQKNISSPKNVGNLEVRTGLPVDDPQIGLTIKDISKNTDNSTVVSKTKTLKNAIIGDIKDKILNSRYDFTSGEDLYQRASGGLRDKLNNIGIKYKSEFEKFWDENIGSGDNVGYGMSHRPTKTGATADNLTQEAIPDFYEHPEYYDYGGKEYKESINALMKIRNNPNAEIIIYRASPKNELNNGDWVTLSKEKARLESIAENTKVHSFKVKAKDVQFAGDDITEFGYWGLTK